MRGTVKTMLRVLLCVCVAGCASGKSDPDGRPTEDATAPVDAVAADARVHDASLVDAVPADARLDDAAPADAPGPPVDAPPPIDAAPDAPTGPTGTHLLLTEVVLQPTEGEFIEIFNPTDVTITLTDYYLADVSDYYKLPAGTQNVGTNDFIVRFPQGAAIQAGEMQTFAIATAADFFTAYGVNASGSIGAGDGGPVVQLIQVDVGSNPTLTNAGESIVLFYWDGESDLVKDVDLLNAGEPTGSNLFSTKSSAMVDGPDPDSTPSTYATDAFTLGVQASAPGDNRSTKRILPETGHELTGGSGNGILGDDETSEQIGTTWDHSPYTAPNPGAVAEALGPQ